jgi:uncharacterized protein (DUF433 family)
MAAVRGHLSIRPLESTLERLRIRARLAGEQRTTLAERYLREGLLMDEFPGIHFVDGAMGRRPAIAGTGLDVWEIVKVIRDNDGSAQEAAAYLEIEPRLVEIAVHYYGSNRDEIDDWIARVHEFSEREQAKWLAGQEAIAS